AWRLRIRLQQTPARRTVRGRALASFVVLEFVGPQLFLRGPIFFVVADQPFDVQLAEELGWKATGGEILDLLLEFALLADNRVDLAEAGARDQIVSAPAQLEERHFDDLAHARVRVLPQFLHAGAQHPSALDVFLDERP